MQQPRLAALRAALVTLGVVCLLLGPLMLFWPSGWRWVPHHAHYEQMMVGLYFTLGVFLIRAARDPMQNLSLIWFTVCSCVVHGGIMTVQALAGSEHRAHLIADIPALFLAAAVIGFLTPRQTKISP